MVPETVLRKMVRRIQATRGLEGCVVGYYGEDACRVVGYPSCITPNSENVAVVIEEVYLPKEMSLPPAPKAGSVASVQAQYLARNRTKLGPELAGAGVTCGLNLFSGIGVAASLGAEGVTAGASTLLLMTSWTGFAMGVIQCGNGAVRVGAALADLDGYTLDEWDRNRVYSIGILLVDAIGVATAVGSLPHASRKLWEVFARLRAFNSAKLSFEALRRMNQVERLRMVAKIFNEATHSGEGVAEIVSAAKDAQIAARTMQRASGISINHAATLQRIITDEVVRQLHQSIAEVLASTTGLALSATPSTMTGSGSGSVNWVINLLDAGQPAI